MTDLAELRQRVKLVGEHSISTAEEDRKRSERLSRLLGVVEESFARSQQEIKRSNEDLACANDEIQQLRTMLQTLLAEVEDTGASGTSGAMRDLEDQANRLVESASSISGTVSSNAPEMTKDSPATVSKGKDDRTAARPEIETEPAIGPSEEVSEHAPTLAEEAKDKPGHEAKEEAKSDLTIAELSNLYVAQGCTAEKPTTLVTDEARTPRSKLVQRVQAEIDVGETSTMSPVSGEEATHEREPPGTGGGEEKELLELTQMVTENGAVVKLNTDQGHLAEKDRATLQKIIKRVNLQTGTLG